MYIVQDGPLPTRSNSSSCLKSCKQVLKLGDSEDLPGDSEDLPGDSEDLPGDPEDLPGDSDDLYLYQFDVILCKAEFYFVLKPQFARICKATILYSQAKEL